MNAATDLDLARNVARARVLLSFAALLSIYVDPAAGGAFFVEPAALIVLSLHLLYGAITISLPALGRETSRVAATLAAFDLGFAAAVAFATEGPTSPAYAFFAFAIIAVGCRGRYRTTATVTLAGMSLYLGSILLAHRGAGHPYWMRPAYLGIVGYLIGFLGEQRVKFETRIRELETTAERHRIARSLHDGYVQALAGMNLRLESCRELLASSRVAEAESELVELRTAVTREFDAVRSYVRSLADIDPSPDTIAAAETVFRVHADFVAGGALAEHVLLIMLEGLRNTMRHAAARSAEIRASRLPGALRITIDDDGMGFERSATPPWSIASRVAESGGDLMLGEDERAGAHLDIRLPSA